MTQSKGQYLRRMSRNNLIIVIYWRGRYFVLPNAIADVHWQRSFLRKWVREAVLNDKITQYRQRARALVHAHNLDFRLKTEYGVREIKVW